MKAALAYAANADSFSEMFNTVADAVDINKAGVWHKHTIMKL